MRVLILALAFASQLGAAIPTASLQIEVIQTVGFQRRDMSDRPLRSASIALTGPVTREAITDDNGRVTFDDLPYGAYRLTALERSGSDPHVQDVLVGLEPVTAVRISVPIRWSIDAASGLPILSRMLQACGPAPPKTVAAFLADADAVVHVRIESQYSYDAGDSEDTILTSNQVTLLDTFKSHSAMTRTVLQTGGSVGRGDHIERLHFNQLPPFAVGAEYVLFLKKRAAPGEGLYTHFSENGAYKIVDGVVQPLGGAPSAVEWRGKSANAFLRALRDAAVRR